MDHLWDIELEGHHLAAVLAHSCDSGIPVFFLHGIGGSVSFWTPELTSPFRKVGPCYALSLPGHFPAAFPEDFAPDCLTAELIARLTAGAIRKIVGDRKVLLVGHSTGGFAALSAALYHPEVAAGVVSIAGFSKGQWTGVLGLCQWLVRQGPAGRSIFKKVYQMGGINPAVFRMYWQGYVSDHGALLKNPGFEAVTDAMIPYFRKLDMQAMVAYFSVMPHTDITLSLSRITAPTCLIAGEKDPIVPPAQSLGMAAKIPDARLALLKGAGHLPFLERPADYACALEDWLREHLHHR